MTATVFRQSYMTQRPSSFTLINYCATVFPLALMFSNGWFTACDGFYDASACWLSHMKQQTIPQPRHRWHLLSHWYWYLKLNIVFRITERRCTSNYVNNIFLRHRLTIECWWKQMSFMKSIAKISYDVTKKCRYFFNFLCRKVASLLHISKYL